MLYSSKLVVAYSRIKIYVHVFISDFGLPSNLKLETINPHCLNVSWKKAADPVTGYRIYCINTDSQTAEIIKDIPGVNQESMFISGLKPETKYRVGITAVYSGMQSTLVFQKDEVKLRMKIFITVYACTRLNAINKLN